MKTTTLAALAALALAGCTKEPVAKPAEATTTAPTEPTEKPTAKPAEKPAPTETAAIGKPATCVVPALPADHQESDEIRHPDLDGDGVEDALVPTECDGRGNCDWKVFRMKAGCGTELGTITFADDPSPLPLTSHGIVMITTQHGEHHGHGNGLWGWTGSAWEETVSGDCWIPHSDPDDEKCRTSLAEAPQACLGGKNLPAPSLDVDGDGALEAVLPLEEMGEISGSLLLATQGDCLRPVGVVPSGKLEILAAGKPATLVVRGTAYRGTTGEDRVIFKDGSWQADAHRSCNGRRCDPWASLEETDDSEE
jgi:hypothetical protein